MSLNYNIIDWSSIFTEDLTSLTGLVWKSDRYRGTNLKSLFIKAGECAGYIHSDRKRNIQYFRVKFNNRSWAIHRILWIMRNGYLDDDLLIDHIDGNGLNNSLINLRKVQPTINMRNQRKYKNNSTGKTGVSFTKVGKNTYVVAQWRNSSGNCKKNFSVSTLGLLPAYAQACLYRDRMIYELNNQGFDYSKRHGIELIYTIF